MNTIKLTFLLIILGASLYLAYEVSCPNFGVDLGVCLHKNKHRNPTWYLDSDYPEDANPNPNLVNTSNTSEIEIKPQNFCDLSIAETFTFLTKNSPFNLGNSGSVYFTRRFDYKRNAWIEGKVNISGGLGSNSRLSGQYRVTNRNTINISGLRVTGGLFDASKNGDTYGNFKINCNGNIEGYLQDYNGNTKEVIFKNK